MKRTLKNLKGESTLLEALRAEGISVSAPCGGRRKCGRCKVVANGEEVLACAVKPVGDVEVLVPDVVEKRDGIYDLAIDMGTTNVVASLFDVATGELVDSISVPNAQMSYGADVISRIQYCNEGMLDELRELIRRQVDSFCSYNRLSIAGNTVMESIYAGVDPFPIGVPPFMPSEKFENDDVLMPCISGYVGGDVVAGLAASGADSADGLWLYINFGTNGELALGNGNGFTTCSCAAGPAFECVETLFGSQVIDEVATLLKKGGIGKSGRLKSDSVFSQQDIRNIMLAKAAIRAGAEVLLRKTGNKTADITKLLIAGEFGKYINIENALAIGILPDIDPGIVERIGNASLKGACMGLSREGRAEIRDFAGKCSYIELSDDQLFTDLFLKYLNFQ